MNKTSGDTVYDQICSADVAIYREGNLHGLDDTNPPYHITGKINGAVDFADDVSYGAVDPTSFYAQNQWTVSLWFLRHDYYYNYIFYSSNLEFYYYDGAVYAWVHSASGSNFYSFPITLSTETWYHLALVYDNAAPAGSKLKLYVNKDAISGSATESGSGVTVGYNAIAVAWEDFGYCALDDIMVFQTALPAAALRALYNEGDGIESSQPFASGGGGTRYFYHSNTLYSVYALTDAAGAIVERYAYDPYGRAFIYNASNTQITASALANPYAFTGQRLDNETGLMYYRNRYYDVVSGRFISRDPIGYASGNNLFCAYFVSFSMDPYGLYAEPDWPRPRPHLPDPEATPTPIPKPAPPAPIPYPTPKQFPIPSFPRGVCFSGSGEYGDYFYALKPTYSLCQCRSTCKLSLPPIIDGTFPLTCYVTATVRPKTGINTHDPLTHGPLERREAEYIDKTSIACRQNNQGVTPYLDSDLNKKAEQGACPPGCSLIKGLDWISW